MIECFWHLFNVLDRNHYIGSFYIVTVITYKEKNNDDISGVPTSEFWGGWCMLPYAYLVEVERLFPINPQLKHLQENIKTRNPIFQCLAQLQLDFLRSACC